MKSSPVLSNAPERDITTDELLETWPFVHRMLVTIDAVASSRATVLITGESGTGKELVARAHSSARHPAQRPIQGYQLRRPAGATL